MGLSISSCDKGWESLIEFAKVRPRQDKDLSCQDKSKRKGSRELQGLLSSINYDKDGSKQKAASTKAKVA